MDDAAGAAKLGFDPDALRDKYRQERDKRLRADGEAQYIELAGDFARYAEEDPYADPNFTRAPVDGHVQGEVTAKLGPIISSFVGEARINNDDARRHGTILGAGRDRRLARSVRRDEQPQVPLGLRGLRPHLEFWG